ncbi:MAG: AbrB/MazE/SpoVT family DNA-binding domain-containing protein [Deltaproteobacteria bacterium]|nr:AbrB/MazE/SpoVT family DNA-binding domain-containing protein [Deltaproteobacteria bacterium]
MIKKLTRHGNSYALIIDRPILDLLKIEPETPLEVSTDGDNLLVMPVRDEKRRKKFEAALADTNRKYGGMLKRLAE